MSDNNSKKPESELSEDEKRPPEFVPARPGRMVSMWGLVERIIEQFHYEHGEGESDALKASLSEMERRKLVRDVADYIFSVESVQLELKEMSRIIASAYSELFGYGPLDKLISGDSVTTITLEGARKAAVRHGAGGDLKSLDPIFEDTPHLRKTIGRLLRDAGAELREDIPIVETGLEYEGQQLSVTVATPPYVTELAVDIRVHPKELPTLDSLVDSGFMTEKNKQVLEAIVKSGHGFVIVGDTESGKTTLLSMLAQRLPNPEGVLSVERAGELRMPEGAKQLVPTWPVANSNWVTFGERIKEAIEAKPETLLLDEIRADEPEAIAPLLNQPDMPRQIWSFRGASEATRIRSALGMVARMADRTQSEAMVFNLYERLPFIIIVKRRKGYLQLKEIAEWQFPDGYKDADDFVYADYVTLMERDGDACEPTGKRPKHDITLPDDFWEA